MANRNPKRRAQLEAQHPSRYGANLTAGTGAPPQLKHMATYSDGGNYVSGAARRHRQVNAQKRLDRENAIDPSQRAALEEIIGVVRQEASALIDDQAAVDKMVEAIVRSPAIDASVRMPGQLASGCYAYAGEDSSTKYLSAVSNACKLVAENGAPCNVVFGGAGVNGISYARAYETLAKLGLTTGVVNFAGCSSGSIIAGLLACKMSPERIGSLCLNQNFSKLLQVGGKSLLRLRNNSVSGGKNLSKWVRSMISEATDGNPDITLSELHNKYGGRCVIVATRLSDTRPVYFDYKSDPDLPLWKAIRMSCSIPWLFKSVEYGGDYYVDGGLLDPYPIRAFHFETNNMDIVNPRTIGLIAMDEGVSYARGNKTSRLAQSRAIIDCILSRKHSSMLDEQDWSRTIVIDCGKMSSLDFGINKEQKSHLMEIAKDAVIDHFAAGGAKPRKNYFAPVCESHSVVDEPECVRGMAVKANIAGVAEPIATSLDIADDSHAAVDDTSSDAVADKGKDKVPAGKKKRSAKK